MLLNKIGVLLINLGTPDAPTVWSVGRYLNEFLSDPRVIELPFLLRAFLVKGVIVPTRSSKSAEAYASIWQKEGSPLLVNSKALESAIQAELGAEYLVVLGMRYGRPSIIDAIKKLYAANIYRLIIIPLFPQYASATSGSAIQQALRYIAKQKNILPFTVLNDFYIDEHYLSAQAAVIQPFMEQDYEFLLLSYHGLPQRQLINPGVDCYRTRCITSAQKIAEKLKITSDRWRASFQSRLGKLEWIRPYTDEELISLREKGIKRILIACPSFVTDCLETLEEIGIRAKEQWLELGGEKLQLIPCLNVQPVWINSFSNMIKNL